MSPTELVVITGMSGSGKSAALRCFEDIGYYCMACGRELSVDEIVLLIDKAQKTSQPIPTSEKSEVTPPMEIKEMPSPKAKEPERAIRDANERDTSEHA